MAPIASIALSCARILTVCAASFAATATVAATASAPDAGTGSSSMSTNAPGTSASIDADKVIAVFPAKLDGWKMASIERPLPPHNPQPSSLVEASYQRGTERIAISVSSGMAASGGARQWQADTRADRAVNMQTVTLANGLFIAATSASADAKALRKVLEALDLGQARKAALKAGATDAPGFLATLTAGAKPVGRTVAAGARPGARRRGPPPGSCR